MAQLHTAALHRQAKALLSRQGESPKRLVLLHTLLALGIPLLALLINILLDQQIAKTGGLGGMAARSTLETVQSMLELGIGILLPFWEMGLLFAALRWRRGQRADKTHLTEGFRRFVNIFALRLWSGILYIAVGFAALYASSLIFSATPWAKPLTDLLASIGELPTPEQIPATMTPELINQLLTNMMPLYIIFGILYAAVCIFLFCRLRFADFILLEGEGGIRSIAQSFQLTRGSCWQICKLELHFWWFYLLQALILVLCFGSEILTLLGVTLPIDPNLSFFLFYAVGLLLEGFLLWRYQGQRLTTYALAYDALQPQDPTILPEDLLQEI